LQPIPEPYTYLLVILVTIIVAYRVIVALAFGILASKLRGRFGVSKKEMAYIIAASFFDTVLGIFILAMSALTKEVDPRKVKRIISRMKEDGSRILATLEGIQEPNVRNLAKDVELVVEKISQIEEDPRIESEEALDILEKMEAELLYIRDKADDISVETDQKVKAKIIAICAKRATILTELLRKLLATIT
jgi:divalent metal cation (Fe/Co/Zn/Cd) transporter